MIYQFKGKTKQKDADHPNIVFALKVDESADPSETFAILDETKADAEGNFTLTWADWGERVDIIAIDDDPTEELDPVLISRTRGVEA